MKLKTNDGISCDLCAAVSKEKFTYYSAKILKIDVDVSAKRTTSIATDLDLDVCEKCYNVIRGRVAAVIKNREGKT